MSIGAFGVSFGIRLALFLNSFSLLRTLYRFTQMRRVRDAFRIGLLRYPPTECGGIIASGDPAQFRVICLSKVKFNPKLRRRIALNLCHVFGELSDR